MEVKIQKLYEILYSMVIGYLYYQSRKNIEEIKEAIPLIQEFALWFMSENQFELNQELYQELCNNLLLILQDISTAIEQKDHVLLHDSVAYGLMDYLKLFVEQKEASDDNI